MAETERQRGGGGETLVTKCALLGHVDPVMDRGIW